MPSTTLVNKRYTSSDEWDVDIGRGSNARDMLETPIGEKGWLGNPAKMGQHGDREECVTQYAVWFARRMLADERFQDAVDRLEGKTLACYCAPKACHGDVILEYLENGLPAVVERWEL